MKRTPFLVIPLAVAAAAVAAVALRSRKAESADELRVSGNIEVTEVDVSFKIAGRMIERLVDEGDSVSRGQVVARLDDSELARQADAKRAELAAANAALAELEAGSREEEIAAAAAVATRAKAVYDEMLAGSRPEEIAGAAADVENAEASVAFARTEFERQKELLAKAVSSQQAYDAASASYDAAQARLKAAEERYKLAKEGPRREDIEQARAAAEEAAQRSELVRKGPRKETIDSARAKAAQAEAALELAETQFGCATLMSPTDGVVLSKNVEPGEYVAAGTPVVTVGDLANVYLRAYVNETDLGRVKIGQKVRLTTDTYPGKTYEGRVTFISSQAEFTPKNVQTLKERVKLVYRIKVSASNPAMELKAGMPADGLISLQ